jgi:alkylhydroperoxidase family enzyme
MPYCVDMHTKDARALGEDERRLHLVAVWREAPCFTDRERVALAWSEALTLLPQSGVPDDLYREAEAVFSDEELVALTAAVVAINGWNRFSAAFRTPVGDYVSPLGGPSSQGGQQVGADAAHAHRTEEGHSR